MGLSLSNTSESSERPMLLLPPAYFSPGLFLVILESDKISPLSIFMAAGWMKQTSCGTMSFRFACHGWSNKGQNAWSKAVAVAIPRNVFEDALKRQN